MQQGEGAQRPQSVKGKGPKDPGVEAPLASAGCRGNHLLNASCVEQLDRPVGDTVCYSCLTMPLLHALATRNTYRDLQS